MESRLSGSIVPARNLSVGYVSLFLLSTLPAVAEPVVPALSLSDLSSDLKGQILIEELNCVACHVSEGMLKDRSKKAPRLSGIGSRLDPTYIRNFIRDPHVVKPGTTKPDALAGLSKEEKDEAAEDLTHFLLSLREPDFAPSAPDPVAAAEGHRLFHSRGCSACHAPRDEQTNEIPLKGSVPLGQLEKKYSHASLVKFLRDPHAIRPSGRMPNLQLQGRDAERIAHFLLQKTEVPGPLRYTLYRGQVWEGLDSENVVAERGGQVSDFSLDSLGKVEQHTAIRYEGWLSIEIGGSYRFLVTMNGGTLQVGGRTVVNEAPSDRRGVKSFEEVVELDPGPHEIRFTYFHTGREAELKLEVEGPGLPRGPVPPDLLSVSKDPVAPFESPKVDALLAAKGREQFTKFGCANCHDDLDLPLLPSPALATLDPSRGCLADQGGPRYDLSETQRSLIASALPKAEEPVLDDAQKIDKTLASLNCVACHDRAGLGGPDPERRALFTSSQPSLGDQGRLPPTLSHVGAKLTRQWLESVILNGGRQRDYMDAAMPQFGREQVGHLVELFDRVDKLEEAKLPVVEQIVESKAAGYELVGATGMACITCHQFNGQKAGEISALDIAKVPERLKRNWFDLYMRQPSRFHATTIMPGFWPDGKSVRANILGGDTDLQIEAIWNYLADGERARKPVGLSRQTNELRVGDVAEICRGRGSEAGFRGIGVGYPGRVSLAFDSTEMSLRTLWRGAFANVDNGSFHPRGEDRISLPPGVPFHRLKSPDENWPYKGKSNHAFPKDHGYRWEGYRLDEQRRPVFRYRYGEIEVDDYFEDRVDTGGRAYFQRTLRLVASAPQEPFHFRAAAGLSAVKISETEFRLKSLQLRIEEGREALVREGNPSEVLIPLHLPKGETQIVLEYRW